MKILDKYIIKKFIGTYIVAILLIIVIVIIFDISEKIDDFVEKEAPLNAIIFDYYLNFIPYFMNMFSPLFVFITVIFFTSKLASNSEIIAILSGGVSFKRLMYPYFISATAIAAFSLILSLFVIPSANKTRLEFEQQYRKGAQISNTSRDVHYQIDPGQFAYVESFSTWNNTGYKFTLETIEDNKIKSKLTAENITWNKDDSSWTLKNYFHRKYNDGIESISSGKQMDTTINLVIDDFYRRSNTVESLKYNELEDLIKTQKLRGDQMVKFALIEKHTRFALPFSAFILSIIGVSLSSRKVRGGIGLKLGIGIGLSFTYILFQKFSQMFVVTDTLPAYIAIWLPNLLFGIISIVLYKLAPK